MLQIIDKLVGETPLEALERFRLGKIQAEKNGNDTNSGASILGTHSWKGVPLTYAGRLDPMAEGKLLILIGEECKDKEKYLWLDKEYEVEIVIGLETDTYDALGIVTNEIGASGIHLKSESKVRWMSIESNDLAISAGIETVNQQWLQRYTGKFVQPYPPYSSKTVNGKQLHELARSGELPTQDEMPTKEVEIYLIDLLSGGKIGADLLLAKILQKIDLVKGDFRQEEIKKQWVQKLTKNWSTLPVMQKGLLSGDHTDTSEEIANQMNHIEFALIKLRVKCSSGTYMRSLAHRIGRDLGTGAFALSIKRTKICAG